jgi:GAF domain-containing protein
MQRKDDEKIQDAERLATLQRTYLLDTPPEEAFDRLTRLATTLLRVPVALVSLVDGDRQFFKSCVGLPEPLASLRQTPLTHSFCKHVVASGEPLILSDIRNSSFKDDPSVFGLGEMAYTGIPLITTEGHALGSFCVVDTRRREWTDEEIETLRSLASSVMTEIAARRTAKELRELSNDLQRLVEERTCQLSHAEERWRVLLQVNNALVTCLDRETLPTIASRSCSTTPSKVRSRRCASRAPCRRPRPFPSHRPGRDTAAVAVLSPRADSPF